MDPSASTAESEADDVRAAEHERIRALVHGDLEVTRQLNADDFQSVTLPGVVLLQKQYLEDLRRGSCRQPNRAADSTLRACHEITVPTPLRSRLGSHLGPTGNIGNTFIRGHG